MAALTRQTNFSAGELAPTLYGRTDVEQYRNGARTLLNFFVSKHGAAVSRPGMRLCSATLDQSTGARLVPFVASNGTSYILVYTARGFSVMKDGAYTATPPYTIPNSDVWSPADIGDMRWIQVADSLFIVCAGYPPTEIAFTSESDWSATEMDFNVLDYNGTTPLLVDDSVTGKPYEIQDSSETYPERDWKFRITILRKWFDGTIRETKPYEVASKTPALGQTAGATAAPDRMPIYPHTPVSVQFRSTGLLSSDTEPFIIRTRIYRGRKGVFGFVGEVIGGQDTDDSGYFTDYGDEPDYSISPPEGRNPFRIFDSDDPLETGTEIRTEYPRTIGVFEQRLVFGGTDERPERLWLSRTNDYTNFDVPFVPTADSSVEIELASRRREHIRAIVGLDRLLVFTDNSVWAVGGAGGAPITPTDLNEARVQSDVGAANLDPIVIGDSVLYVRSKGSGVRDLTFSNDRGAFVGGDVSFLAQHFFRGMTITRWCYAEDPYGIVWAVRDDGKMLSFTYDRSNGTVAWALHETDGEVFDVVSVPNGERDDVYMLVTRDLGGIDVIYVERFAPRDVDSVMDTVCLDSALTGTGAINISHPSGYDRMTTHILTGTAHLTGKEVYAVADGDVLGPYTVNGNTLELLVGGMPIEPLPRQVHVGLRYNCDLELLDLAEARNKQKAVKEVVFDAELSRGAWAGEDFDHLTEYQQRRTSDDYDPLALETGRVRVRIGSTWNITGRAVIRQVDPLPLTVLGVDREGGIGG